MNLSGEVFSHAGPLSEIYDGSPESENYYALTSFVGLNAQQRKQLGKQTIIHYSLSQLKRLFGEASQNVLDIKIKDWSQDELTTIELDITLPVQHPQHNEQLPRSFLENKLLLAGTECARQHGGYLEGALESADEVLQLLTE